MDETYLPAKIMAKFWQPIESAPKNGTLVLLGDFKDPEEHEQGVARWHEGMWTDGFQPHWYWTGSNTPTHWMPLPEPPCGHQIAKLSPAEEARYAKLGRERGWHSQ